MKLDKKQVPQVVVLGVLLLACIGYVGFKFAAPAPPPPPAATDQAQTKDGADGNIAGESEETLAEKVAKLPPSAKRDPFAPAMVAFVPQSCPPRQTYTSPVVRERVMQRLTPNRPVPKFPGPMHIEPIPLTMLSGRSTGSEPSAQSVSSGPVDPSFLVTGVIRGAKNVAVIRDGDQRHIVREGQYLQDRYKVVSVTDDGVILLENNRRISLRLGGEKNAKQ